MAIQVYLTEMVMNLNRLAAFLRALSILYHRMLASLGMSHLARRMIAPTALYAPNRNQGGDMSQRATLSTTPQSTINGKRDSEYLLARLKCDHPEILEAYECGKFIDQYIRLGNSPQEHAQGAKASNKNGTNRHSRVGDTNATSANGTTSDYLTSRALLVIDQTFSTG